MGVQVAHVTQNYKKEIDARDQNFYVEGLCVESSVESAMIPQADDCKDNDSRIMTRLTVI